MDIQLLAYDELCVTTISRKMDPPTVTTPCVPTLKSQTLCALSAPAPAAQKHPRSTTSKVVLQPSVPGTRPLLNYGPLAPVMLQLEGRKEVFLWDSRRTELLAEYQFALKMLGDLQLQLPKSQLLSAADQLALNIRDQVQRYREVIPAHSPGQGLLKEHVVTIEVRGERVLWDIGCPSNSPEMYAKVLCEDLKLHPSESVHIAFEIRTQLKEHLRRLVMSVNSRLRRVTTVPERLPTPPSLYGLEENLIELLPLPVKRHKSDDHRTRIHKHHRPRQENTENPAETQG